MVICPMVIIKCKRVDLRTELNNDHFKVFRINTIFNITGETINRNIFELLTTCQDSNEGKKCERRA